MRTSDRVARLEETVRDITLRADVHDLTDEAICDLIWPGGEWREWSDKQLDEAILDGLFPDGRWRSMTEQQISDELRKRR